jgi:hypothetical protein
VRGVRYRAKGSRAVCGTLGVLWGVCWVLLEVVCVLSITSAVVHGALAWASASRSTHLAVAVAQVAAQVENALERMDGINLDVGDGLAAELHDVIGETLGSMHVPTAADHLMGMVSTFMQARLMKEMGPEGLAGLMQPSEGSSAASQDG